MRERCVYSQWGHGSFLLLSVHLPQAHVLTQFALHMEGDAAQLECPRMLKIYPHRYLQLHEGGKDVEREQQFLAALAGTHQEGP